MDVIECYLLLPNILVRKDNDVNEHERLSDVTLGHSVKFKKKKSVFILLFYIVLSLNCKTMTNIVIG